ncbi:MAG: glucose-6-phosphate isomerase [Firmicutes bacterium]|nr:glucose-6-phosphate isomerase [Bacillota bacterium]
MTDLQGTSGLPLAADSDGRLVFGAGLPAVKPDVRYKKDMEDVLLDAAADGPAELYYMYRGVAREKDKELLAAHGLRYDVTVIRPGRIGREYIKTAGHYHPVKPGTETTYPEVYEVLAGKAHYLLQTEPDEEGVDAVIVEAQPGDKVLIPPGYGHITINPGPELLVMSNWVADGFASLYGPIRELRGGAYFEVAAEGEDEQFLVNPNYRPTPRLAVRPVEDFPHFGLVAGKPMYLAFLADPNRFAFLTHPEDYF